MALDVRVASAADCYTGKVAGDGETRAAHAGSAAQITSGPLPATASQVAIPSASEPSPRQPKVVQSIPVVPEKANRPTPGTLARRSSEVNCYYWGIPNAYH